MRSMNLVLQQNAELIKEVRQIKQAQLDSRGPNNHTYEHETQMITTIERTHMKVRGSDDQSEASYKPIQFSDPIIEIQPEVRSSPVKKPKWKNILDLKSKSTVSSYKPYIEAFIKARGQYDTFI